MTHGTRNRAWLLLLLIAVFVAVFGWWGNTRLRKTLEGALQAELETTLRANATALEIWITNQMRLTTVMASDPRLQEAAFEALRAPLPAPGEGRRALPGPRTDLLGRDLQIRFGAVGFESLLVNTNLVVVGGSGRARSRIGSPVEEEHRAKYGELLATGQPILITPFKATPPSRGMGPPGRPEGPRGQVRPVIRAGPPRRGDLMLMQVAAPVRDATGTVVGVLALVIDPDREFSRILSVVRFGESGETYAFDQEGLLLSRSRFDDQLRQLGLVEDKPEATSALNLHLVDPGGDLTQGFKSSVPAEGRPLIGLVANAVGGGAGATVVPSRDYRGVPVIGAWRWLPQHGFGIVTQRNAAEAFKPLRIVWLLFLILFLLLVLSANGLFLASYLGAVWRRQLGEAELKARQLGQYRLEEKIGEGGMGVVYRARHALLRRDTAVKLLLPDRADPETVERFEQEVHLTCQLTHPNTIQVYDYGHTPEGLFYYAMEYLQGWNLRDLVTRHGPQPEGRVVHILTQVCDALEEAHRMGLIHRDIKPANVFLCNRGGLPDTVKVLDFGLVRQFRRGAGDAAHPVRESGMVGTPLFMSPETIRNAEAGDPRSDLYSVGALGYYLLTGTQLFDGDSSEAVCRQHLEVLPVPPRQRTANAISSQIEAVILRCLEKDPDLRPGSAADLGRLLQTSPRAADWTPEARAAWWRQHGAALGPPPEAGRATLPGLPADNIKIDVSGRG